MHHNSLYMLILKLFSKCHFCVVNNQLNNGGYNCWSQAATNFKTYKHDNSLRIAPQVAWLRGKYVVGLLWDKGSIQAINFGMWNIYSCTKTVYNRSIFAPFMSSLFRSKEIILICISIQPSIVIIFLAWLLDHSRAPLACTFKSFACLA